MTVILPGGRVLLPKAIRDRKRWAPGKELVIEETPEGVLLRPARSFPRTKPEDVFGALSHHRKRLSDEEIEKALRAAVERRYARD